MEPIRNVFLSYTSADRTAVTRLAEDLRHRGATVWLDEWEIPVGASITQKIEEGLAACDYLAIWLTTRSIGSSWVEREWRAKYHDEVSGRAVILPLLAEDCDLPVLLRDKKYADFRFRYRDGLSEVLNALGLSKSPSLVGAPICFAASKGYDGARESRSIASVWRGPVVTVNATTRLAAELAKGYAIVHILAGIGWDHNAFDDRPSAVSEWREVLRSVDGRTQLLVLSGCRSYSIGQAVAETAGVDYSLVAASNLAPYRAEEFFRRFYTALERTDDPEDAFASALADLQARYPGETPLYLTNHRRQANPNL